MDYLIKRYAHFIHFAAGTIDLVSQCDFQIKAEFCAFMLVVDHNSIMVPHVYPCLLEGRWNITSYTRSNDFQDHLTEVKRACRPALVRALRDNSDISYMFLTDRARGSGKFIYPPIVDPINVGKFDPEAIKQANKFLSSMLEETSDHEPSKVETAKPEQPKENVNDFFKSFPPLKLAGE